MGTWVLINGTWYKFFDAFVDLINEKDVRATRITSYEAKTTL